MGVSMSFIIPVAKRASEVSTVAYTSKISFSFYFAEYP